MRKITKSSKKRRSDNNYRNYANYLWGIYLRIKNIQDQGLVKGDSNNFSAYFGGSNE